MGYLAKRILIVDDELHHLASFNQALAALCPNWDLVLVTSGAEALKCMEFNPRDIIVADMHMPDMNGTQLLNEVGRKHPKTLRFILADALDKDTVMKCVLGTHQFLPKPCDPESLRLAIERATILDQWLGDEKLRSLVARIRTFPSIPSLYFEVLKELRSPDASAERVGEIIARDMAMTTKVLQMLNSAFYAIPRQITDPTEAVNILGFEMVKSLVLCIQVYSQFDKAKPYYFSMDRLWHHSSSVAHAARKLAMFEELGAEIVDEAFTAGLLHDLGKIVLVTNFGEQYNEMQTAAKRDRLPAWEAERNQFGASHAEVGAYLIGLWGLPLSMAEAAAFHHHPSLSETRETGVLTVVHAANALVHERQAEPEVQAAAFDPPYLESLGLNDRTEIWRDLLAGKPAVKPAAPSVASTETIAPTQADTEVSMKFRGGMKRPAWLLTGVAVGGVVLGLGLFWTMSRLKNNDADAASKEAESASAEISQQEAEAAAQSRTQASNPDEEPVFTGLGTNMTEMVTSNTTNANPAAFTTNAPPSEPPSAFSKLKLRGIAYATTNATIMINNQTAREGDVVEGVRILKIGPLNVIVEHGGEKKVLRAYP